MVILKPKVKIGTVARAKRLSAEEWIPWGIAFARIIHERAALECEVKALTAKNARLKRHRARR